MKTILIVDDEKSVRLSLEAVFMTDYQVVQASNGEEALQVAEDESPDIAIVDLMMPTMSGIELIPLLKRQDPGLPIVVLSAMHDIANVVQAVQSGAAHYLTKPFDIAEVKLVVDMAVREGGKNAELKTLESELARWYDTDSVIGNSPAWLEALSLAKRAAESPKTTVLLLGDSGTGKELVARLVHDCSSRAKAPMIPIHCAAIPEHLMESELFGHEKGSFTGATERRRGCVEMADGGTLFLDEIGEMPMQMQSKLLRFLQDHQFMRVGGRSFKDADVRVVAATNRDLLRGSEEGWFRLDLYYRLNVVAVVLPPLRERRGDVPLLAEHFVRIFGAEAAKKMKTIAPDTAMLLENYSWPGNVREMRNVIERAVVLYGNEETLKPEHLPAEIRGARVAASPSSSGEITLPISIEEEVADLETRLIARAMEESGSNLSKAAVLLQTTRRKLKYKMDQYGIPAC